MLDSWAGWGSAFILLVQGYRNPAFDGLFVAASASLSEPFVALLLLSLYWSIARPLGTELIYLTLLSSFANNTLKQSFATQRPAGDGMWRRWQPSSFSFPSGHAQTATTVFGYLALVAGRRWVRAVLIALIPIVSFSRVYLGAHYPHDVLGGLLAGIICLAAFVSLYPRVRHLLSGRDWPTACAAGLAGSLLLLLLFPTDANGQFPAEMAVQYSGIFAGINLGILCERRWIRFSTEGKVVKRALRLPLGTAVATFVFLLTAQPVTWAAGHNISLWLQFGLVGIAATALAPWFFVRFGLAEREAPAATPGSLPESGAGPQTWSPRPAGWRHRSSRRGS